MSLRATLVAATCFALLASSAQAATTPVTVPATDSGWYDDTGYHSPSNTNYFAGFCGTNQCLTSYAGRDFFTFDVSSVTNTVVGATLRLENTFVGFGSNDASEDYEVHEVTTAPATLIAGGSGLTAIYDDLGDGPLYGTRTVSAADNSTIVEIPLSAEAIAAINAAIGGSGIFALGGTLTTLTAVDPDSEYIFGGTDDTLVRELVLEVQASDHYKCYKAKDLKNPKFAAIAGVQLVDQFTSDSSVEVKKLFTVCTPVDKNGEGVLDPITHLCCYKIKAQKLSTKEQATVTDQFGSLDVEVFKPQLLCQPCTKELIP